MSLASVTAKLRGVALHLARADTGTFYCGRRPTNKTFCTWQPEQATCRKCIARYDQSRRAENDHPAKELLVELDREG